jgi:osmotically-inducible protein OsmY
MKSRIAKTSGLIFLALLAFPVTAALPPADASITEWVNAALSEDSRVASAGIMVTTIEGIVTLTGNVENLDQKNYAELEAKKIRGVLGVLNKINVIWMARPDIDIRQAIRRRFINSSVVPSELLRVNVENGVVTISGTVTSNSEKEEASLLADEVRGVTAINNAIKVIYVSKRSDAEIGADVRAKIGRDVYLTGLPVSVSVDKGVVVLSGEVGNPYEKDRAWQDAIQVSNVSEVKNNLTVRWWEVTPVRTNSPAPSDSALAKWVYDELYADLRIIKPWDVRVKAKGGHVTLSGTLPTMRQKSLAQQDAAEVMGVALVSNLIAVKGPWREDLGIDADARFALSSDYALKSDDINLVVNNGEVTLRGNVNTQYERSQAEKDVSGVLGVQNVVNNIKIDWEPRYLDRALIERIDDRLMQNWKTSSVAIKITVSVQNGTAVLTGQVDTWSQYDEAARVASLTNGVRRVDNRLTVLGANFELEKFSSVPPDALIAPSNTAR